MTDSPVHPAVRFQNGRLCADPRCATLLAQDAEICDECGGTVLESLSNIRAVLCGWADTRPVAFKLQPVGPTSIGRSAAGGAVPDVDLGRLPGSGSVHRRHAAIEHRQDQWWVTQLGSNLLVVNGRERVALATGAATTLRPGDTLEVGAIRLQLLVRT